jgi:hypothetical protein
MLILSIATLVSALAQIGLFGWLVERLVASPVYARLIVETIGGVRTDGLAIAGIPGDLLHTIWPLLFLGPESTAQGVWVSAVLQKTSTVLGLFATQSLVEICFIIFGAWLVRAGLQRESFGYLLKWGRARNWACVGLGLFVQAQAIAALYGLTLSPAFARLEDTGIGFGLSVLLRLDRARYDWLMLTVFPILIPTVLTGTGLVLGWLSGRLISRLKRLLFKQTGRPHFRQRKWVGLLPILVALIVLVILIAPFSGNHFGMARTRLVVARKALLQVPTPFVMALAVQSAPTAAATLTSTPSPSATPGANTSISSPAVTAAAPTAQPTLIVQPSVTPSATPRPTGRTMVTWRWAPYGSILVVNGQDTIVTGMNYNVNYTGLSEESKRLRHRRDFQILHQAGVNSIIGWGVYDQATLEVAQEFGIGVVMPYELDPQGAYENKGYREQIKNDFAAYVKQFKKFPAVWAWNPGGDELMHRMDTEQHRTPDKLQAAADFLVELSALAFEADPNHVSIIKEPRDWYIPFLDQAIRKVRADTTRPDPARYLIYAINVYGHPDEIRNAIKIAKLNSDERMKIGFIVGEYAPFGLPRQDRPANFALIADDVYEISPMGGYVYVFGPDQPNPKAPNPYDPLRLLVNDFSLVDIDGNPIDDAYSSLALKWLQAHKQLPISERTATPIPP